jgi:hypothetical protein
VRSRPRTAGDPQLTDIDRLCCSAERLHCSATDGNRPVASRLGRVLGVAGDRQGRSIPPKYSRLQERQSACIGRHNSRAYQRKAQFGFGVAGHTAGPHKPLSSKFVWPRLSRTCYLPIILLANLAAADLAADLGIAVPGTANLLFLTPQLPIWSSRPNLGVQGITALR